MILREMCSGRNLREAPTMIRVMEFPWMGSEMYSQPEYSGVLPLRLEQIPFQAAETPISLLQNLMHRGIRYGRRPPIVLTTPNTRHGASAFAPTRQGMP